MHDNNYKPSKKQTNYTHIDHYHLFTHRLYLYFRFISIPRRTKYFRFSKVRCKVKHSNQRIYKITNVLKLLNQRQYVTC